MNSGGGYALKSIENYVNYVGNNGEQQLDPETTYKKIEMPDGYEITNNRENGNTGKDGTFEGYMVPEMTFSGQEQQQEHEDHGQMNQHQMKHNSNVEPFFRESQTVYREDKPDAKLAGDEQLKMMTNTTTVATTVEREDILMNMINSTSKA